VHRTIQECPLPFHLEDLDAAEGLPPWLSRLRGLTSDEVNDILTTEWSAIRDPAVAAFRDGFVKSRRPSSLVHFVGEAHGDRWWLKMTRPDGINESECYLHSPPGEDVQNQWSFITNLPEGATVREFYSFFYNLSPGLSPYSRFFPPELWGRYEYEDWSRDDPDHPDPDGKWADAFYIFCTDTGDKILLSPSGALAWELCAELRIVPAAPSFSRFLERWGAAVGEWGDFNYDSWCDYNRD
jgi:hypothetical protein